MVGVNKVAKDDDGDGCLGGRKGVKEPAMDFDISNLAQWNTDEICVHII
jgi:hypothetical protein